MADVALVERGVTPYNVGELRRQDTTLLQPQVQGEHIEPASMEDVRPLRPLSVPKLLLPILPSVLGLNMETRTVGDAGSTSRSRRQRGSRRIMSKVPCGYCIKRASDKSNNNDDIELCNQCTAMLRQPRRSQQESLDSSQTALHSSSRSRSSSATTDSVSNPLAAPWSTNTQEQHSLQFFLRHSAPQLAGYFDSPFWERMVLQAGRHEPAVRHAIAAVGALHEKLLTGRMDTKSNAPDATTRFALEQCNKSIRHLTRDSGRTPNLRLMLTTCVLFTCFEAMQGNCEQAIAHATQGHSLLQQYAADPTNRDNEQGAFPVELDQLSLMMQRLQTQAKGMLGSGHNGISNDWEPMKVARFRRFETLHEARAGIELLLNQVSLLFLELELDDQLYDLMIASADKYLRFAPWLQSWEQEFTNFLVRKHSSLNETERKGAMVLKAHHIVAEVLSNVDLSLGELGWDTFHNKFAAIVDLAEAVLGPGRQTGCTRPRDQDSLFAFDGNTELSFSLGIVDPLYEVCYRCRDPMTRRRALRLLAQHPRQEGMWSSWSAWKVGSYLMKLEEEGAEGLGLPMIASDIASENRVSEAWFDFSQPKLTGRRYGDHGRVKYRFARTENGPRRDLNPGLFAEECGGYSLGQVRNSASYLSGDRCNSDAGNMDSGSLGGPGASALSPLGATFGFDGDFDVTAADWVL